MFRIQVFSTDVDQGVVDEALNISHNQSRKVGALLPSSCTNHTFDHTFSFFKTLALTFGSF
jgi:hypothetical protein